MSTATATATGDGVPGMFMAKVGMPAPDFNLPSTKNLETLKENVTLGDYKGKWLILMFYPLDFTALCPTELTAFSDRLEEVQDWGPRCAGSGGRGVGRFDRLGAFASGLDQDPACAERDRGAEISACRRRRRAAFAAVQYIGRGAEHRSARALYY
jgi:hypothetical protein